MNRNIIRTLAALALSAVVCAGLAGCGSSNQPAGSASGSSSGSASAAAVSSSGSSSAASSDTAIELNQTVTTDDYELTLTGVEWTDSIKVQTSEYFSWALEADSQGGETMLVVRGNFKNLGASDYSLMAIDTSFKVNDKYELSGRTSAPDSSISPLSSEEVYFYAPTSNEMKDTFKDGTMTIKLKSCKKEGDSIKFGNDYIGEYTLKIAA